MSARILIVKSNPMSFDLSAHMLKAFGYTVFSAEGLQAGISAALRQHPDLIVCEVQPPAIQGLEAARQFKALPETQDTPLVAITDDAIESGWEQIFDAGFDGYVASSADPDAFVARIERFLCVEKRARPEETLLPAPQQLRPAARTFTPHATVLVVDDVETNRHLVRCLLEPEGYAIVEAHNVTEAYRLAEEQRPDAILSDINLGLETGYQLFRKLQDQPELRGIPFILMSSTDRNPREQEENAQFRSITFILRPTEARPLLEVLTRTLKSKAA